MEFLELFMCSRFVFVKSTLTGTESYLPIKIMLCASANL